MSCSRLSEGGIPEGASSTTRPLCLPAHTCCLGPWFCECSVGAGNGQETRVSFSPFPDQAWGLVFPLSSPAIH